MSARRSQQRGNAKVRWSRCRRCRQVSSAGTDVAVRIASGRRAAGDRACEGRVLIQSRRWCGVRHPRPPRLGPRPRICTLDHVSLQFYAKSTSLTVDVLCGGVLLLLHHHLLGPWSLLQRGGLRSAGAVGTPARRVLFESHRDGRVCRVARDSSSSDSNLLRVLLAWSAALVLVLRPELRAVARGSRSRAVGRCSSSRVYLAWSTITFVLPHVQGRAFSRKTRRSRSRLWITILGTPAFFRAIFRPQEIADDLTERCQELLSRHFTTRTFDPAGRIVRRFDEPSPWREVHPIEVSLARRYETWNVRIVRFRSTRSNRDEMVHWHSESLRRWSTRERTSTVTPRDRFSV